MPQLQQEMTTYHNLEIMKRFSDVPRRFLIWETICDLKMAKDTSLFISLKFNLTT